jgi:predicted ATPase
VLSIAAVVGREFRLDVLQQVTGLSEEEVISALEEAEERAVIEERSGAGEALVFRFTHAFFRQTLYEEIFAARRIRWHQQVARALETVHAAARGACVGARGALRSIIRSRGPAKGRRIR